MRAWAVIPVLDERGTIAGALGALPDAIEGAVVVDGGSRDGTAEVAARAGARVLVERRRGYGLAVLRGLEAAREAGADAYLIFDGNGTAAAEDLERVLAPVLDGADLVVGTRPPSSLRPIQRLGNRLAAEVIARRFGVRFRDLGAIRAITERALGRLGLDELGHGWPMQLYARAAARGLWTVQVPVEPQPRRGRSKVSGSLRGTAGASSAFVRLIASECVLGRAVGGGTRA